MNSLLGNNFFRSGLDFFDYGNRNQEIGYLKTDIYEKEDAYYLKIEVPGIEKENLDIYYEKGYLIVSVKQTEEIEEACDYIRKERFTKEMQRTFYVGEIREESIKASYQNGILTVRLEKMKEPSFNKKQITIE